MPRRQKKTSYRFFCDGCAYGSFTMAAHQEHINECDYVCFCGSFPGAPFEGLKGMWIKPATWAPKGFKSFGHYVCPEADCKLAWVSAHAHSHFKQSCKECNIMVSPCCMWLNDKTQTRTFNKPESSKPHRADLCELCRSGHFCVYV